MREYPYYLYHICREADKFNFSVGYVGVSNHPRVRWKSRYKKNPHMVSALAKYRDIVYYVVLCGTKKECLRKEKKLRSKKNIGWNIAIGGGMPSGKRDSNYRHSEKTKEKMRAAQQKLREFNSKRMVGEKNPMSGVVGKERPAWKGWYITPDACFDSEPSVCEYYGISRPAVQRRCKIGGTIGTNRWTPPEWWGKTWQDLGWYFIDKEKK